MRDGKFCMVLGLLRLSLCLSIQSYADTPEADLSRFAILARKVTDEPLTKQPNATMSEALEILHRAAFRVCRDNASVTDEQINQKLKPFEQKLNPTKNSFGASDPVWFDITTARRKNLIAIAVTFGAVSRLKIHDTQTGKPLSLPAAMHWFHPFHPHPQFADDATLLLVSETVQDAGVRTGLRLDTLHQQGNRFALTQTVARQYNLVEQPPPQINNNRIRITSVDDPQNFFFASSDTRLGRTEIFEVRQGRLAKLRDQKQDRALRAVDAWMTLAKRVPQPNSQQRLVRRYLPQPNMVDDCTVKRLSPTTERVTLKLDSIAFDFVVQTIQGAEKVVAAKTVLRRL